MRIVALGQQKGGVGKSAVAINLACQGAASGAKVAIVDMDEEQATTLKWAKRRDDKERPFTLPANAVTLPSILDRLKREGFAWVFLDLPGRNAALASAGLVAADLILVPCRPLEVDIEASVATVKAAKRANKRYVYLMNIVPVQHEQQRAEQMAGTLEALGHPVAPPRIVQRLVVPDAIAQGQSAREKNSKSPSADEFKKLFQWLEKELP